MLTTNEFRLLVLKYISFQIKKDLRFGYGPDFLEEVDLAIRGLAVQTEDERLERLADKVAEDEMASRSKKKKGK